MKQELSFENLLPILKLTMKAKGITYADLAKHLGFSEANVKKMMLKGDCSFNRLSQICDYLGLSVGELIKSIEPKRELKIDFSTDQIEYLVKNPDSLRIYFMLVYENRSTSDVKAELNLKESSFLRKLASLESKKLIRIEKDGRNIKATSTRYGVWPSHGALADRLRKNWSRAMTTYAAQKWSNEGVRYAVRYFGLTEESRTELKQRIKELLSEYERRMAHEAALNLPIVPTSLLWVQIDTFLSDFAN